VIRIVLCDDHPLLREGLKAVLAQFSDLQVTGEAASGAELLEMVRAKPVDVVMLDLTLPDRSGLDLLKDLAREPRPPAVVVLTMHPEEQYAVRALRAGAGAYLEKGSAPEELVAAVRKVAAGGRYITSSLAELLAESLAGPADAPHEALSDREYQVLCRIAAGRAIKDIAAELFLSPTTIATYRSRILTKLGLGTTAEIVRYAVDHRLIE
jgi:two-component system invasion response regulator UvrY